MAALYKKGDEVLIVGPSKKPEHQGWVNTMSGRMGMIGKIIYEPEKYEDGTRYKVSTVLDGCPSGWWYWDDEICPVSIRCKL